MKGVVLITGASAGIGKATARRLLNEGYTVYGGARRVALMADLKQHGMRVLELDMIDEQSIAAAVQTVLSEQKRIDVLFNNAGFGMYGSIEEVSIDDARHQFEVNLFGLARLTQLVIPHMRAQKSGIIINNSSVGGKVYTPLSGWYYATKHALEGWSDCLRVELRQFGIRVVIIEPGLIHTEFGRHAIPSMQQKSGTGPYRGLAKAITRFQGATGEDGSKRKAGGSPPVVIARVVSRAIRAKRPKTRYAAGRIAKLSLFLRKHCSDRLFDRLIMMLLR